MKPRHPQHHPWRIRLSLIALTLGYVVGRFVAHWG